MTINVGLASVYVNEGARRQVMGAWATRTITHDRADIVFAQECDNDWLALWDEEFNVVRWNSRAPAYKPRSAILGRRGCVSLEPVGLAELPTLAYHGSYVAAACWGDHPDRPLLASVHASPNEVEARYARLWSDGVPLPPGRFGVRTAATRSVPWDSEMVLATLGHVASRGRQLLAAGDLNEARGWDRLPEHAEETWGEEFFASLEGWRLQDALLPQWDGEERATHWNAKDLRALQLDHVLGSPRMAKAVSKPVIPRRLGQERPFSKAPRLRPCPAVLRRRRAATEGALTTAGQSGEQR